MLRCKNRKKNLQQDRSFSDLQGKNCSQKNIETILYLGVKIKLTVLFPSKENFLASALNKLRYSNSTIIEF